MTGNPNFTLALAVTLERTVPPALALAGLPIALVGSILALRGPHPGWAPSPAPPN